ncbi:MAG: TonB-dependent receptor [Pseudomonadota bacterium]
MYQNKTPWLALALLLACARAAHAGPGALIPVVEIITAAPLAGGLVLRSEIAAAVQHADADDIAHSGALELGEFMNRRLAGVHVNETQGNPFQMDVNYRGFTASPLLGAQQGLSVFVDGMRMNQPFGDVVSWDLVPRAAIASMTLMAGSNPLFGLNTLGGALAVQTKDGRSNPGTSLQASGGSFGRRALEFERGGANEAGLAWYLTGNEFREGGWRDDSPSAVRQLFGKLGWRDARSAIDLSVSGAANRLSGNGLQEQGLLARDRASVYSRPDQTQNRALMLNLVARHDGWSGNAYFRTIHGATLNGDVNDDALDQALYQPGAAEQAALAKAGYSGFPASGATAANTPFPSWRCIAQALLGDEPAEKCNALLNRTSTGQRNFGLSAQLAVSGTLAGRRNQLLAGAAYDASRIDFSQSSQLGYLNAQHGISTVDVFGDGSSSVDGAPFDTRVALSGRIHTWSVYASDMATLAEHLQLTLSGRYNATSVRNRDWLHADGDSRSLSSDQRFARLNPALGLTFNPSRLLNLYAGLSESSRAPSAIELGCANPEQPCKLPNAMAGDPPLRQVVTRSAEAGVRGDAGSVLHWSAGAFSARNRDDILFVADNQAGFGYFKNAGATRRRGLELGLGGKRDALEWGANLTMLDATYQSAELVNGSANSSNEDGTIAIHPGDRIPLVPRRLLKLFADYAATPALTLSGGVQAVSGATARGNDNGGHQADGTFYLGPGRSAGYVVANFGAAYALSARWHLSAQLSNAFDTRYSSAGQLGATAFDAAGNFVARPFGGSAAAGYRLRSSTFLAPGAPRQITFALRYNWL